MLHHSGVETCRHAASVCALCSAPCNWRQLPTWVTHRGIDRYLFAQQLSVRHIPIDCESVQGLSLLAHLPTMHRDPARLRVSQLTAADMRTVKTALLVVAALACAVLPAHAAAPGGTSCECSPQVPQCTFVTD
jgi:hypothetical protein